MFFPGYPTKENVAKQLRWKKWNPNQHGPMKIHELSLLATSSFWTPRSKAQWLHGSSRLTKTWLLAGVHFSRGYCSPSLHPEAATEQRGFSTMFTFIARSLFSTLEIQHLSSPAAARRKLRKAPWNFRMHVASRVTFVNVAKWTRTICMAEIRPVEGKGTLSFISGS